MLTISFGERSVRTMTFGFGFCLVLYGVGFGSVRVLARFFTFGFGSVLAKPGFWFGSFLRCLSTFPSLNFATLLTCTTQAVLGLSLSQSHAYLPYTLQFI